MKKSTFKTTLLLSLICFISLLNNFVFKNLNSLTFLGIILVLLFISYSINGLNHSHKRFEKDINITIMTCVISYYLILYLSGLFLGFNYNVYNIGIFSIIKNIWLVLPTILLMEMLRYSINYQINNQKVLYILSFLSFFLLDTTMYISNINFGSIDLWIDNVSLFVIPSIGKNIFLTYLTTKQNYRSQILYRYMMELPIYFVPIVPDLGVYLQAVCELSFPIIVLFFINQFYKKLPINQEKVSKQTSRSRLATTFTIVLLGVVVSLTAGLGKHQAIVIASGSMQPYLYRGDVVIVTKLNDEEKADLAIDDLLVFKRENKIVVHRIYRKVQNGTSVFFETKGDNNESSDGYLIELNEIIGTTHYKIKYIGLPTIFLYELFH